MRLAKRISQAALRVRAAAVSEDLIIRLRWFLLLTGILGIYIGFQVGDDWYVKEFATYDWARGMGY
ncbi:MAG: hypothetical protein FJ149_06450 [Euryarchaeota archaeon]|nr:hypothetical protein [Euryarchaeota archaeon]